VKLKLNKSQLNEIRDLRDRSIAYSGDEHIEGNNNRVSLFIYYVLYNEFQVPELEDFEIMATFVEYLNYLYDGDLKAIYDIKKSIERFREKGMLYDFITIFIDLLPKIHTVAKHTASVPFFWSEQKALIPKLRRKLYGRSVGNKPISKNAFNRGSKA
jgi:hypothetical protein